MVVLEFVLIRLNPISVFINLRLFKTGLAEVVILVLKVLENLSPLNFIPP